MTPRSTEFPEVIRDCACAANLLVGRAWRALGAHDLARVELHLGQLACRLSELERMLAGLDVPPRTGAAIDDPDSRAMVTHQDRVMCNAMLGAIMRCTAHGASACCLRIEPDSVEVAR